MSSVRAAQCQMGKKKMLLQMIKWLLEKDLSADTALFQDILSEFVLRSQENYGNLLVMGNPPGLESNLTTQMQSRLLLIAKPTVSFSS